MIILVIIVVFVFGIVIGLVIYDYLTKPIRKKLIEFLDEIAGFFGIEEMPRKQANPDKRDTR